MKPLPKIEHPIYPIELPVSKLKLKVRPYLKKEDKILLMAIEEGTEDALYSATKQVIQNCIIEGPINFNLDNLSIVDVQYFFLQLRKRSVGPEIRMVAKCENEVTKEDKIQICGHSSGLSVPIDSIELKLPEKDFNKIMITPTLGFIMKYPTFADSIELSKLDPNKTGTTEKIIVLLIDKIFTDKEMFEDCSNEDLTEFVDNLSYDQFKKLENFLANLPSYKYSSKHICPKCGNETQLNVEGFASFFE